MLDDDATLPESITEALVRASFADDEVSAVLIGAMLREGDARERVLALRAGARRTLLDPERWRAALSDEDPLVRREAATLVASESDSEVDQLLAAMLEDGDALVVEAAARAVAEVVGCAFIIDLPELGGRKRLEAMGMPVHALCEFEGL